MKESNPNKYEKFCNLYFNELFHYHIEFTFKQIWTLMFRRSWPLFIREKDLITMNYLEINKDYQKGRKLYTHNSISIIHLKSPKNSVILIYQFTIHIKNVQVFIHKSTDTMGDWVMIFNLSIFFIKLTKFVLFIGIYDLVHGRFEDF